LKFRENVSERVGNQTKKIQTLYYYGEFDPGSG